MTNVNRYYFSLQCLKRKLHLKPGRILCNHMYWPLTWITHSSRIVTIRPTWWPLCDHGRMLLAIAQKFFERVAVVDVLLWLMLLCVICLQPFLYKITCYVYLFHKVWRFHPTLTKITWSLQMQFRINNWNINIGLLFYSNNQKSSQIWGKYGDEEVYVVVKSVKCDLTSNWA